ncbi:MAG: alpha/beta hydrolase [Dolichospermum sp. JUN01]|nr:alpha/beta hydrolase [Dolichospermum sp. JUN01]
MLRPYSCQLLVVKLLPITNYQLPITNYQLPITNYLLPIPLFLLSQFLTLS